MEKTLPLPINNCKYEDADFVIFGVPNDNGSRYRKGSRYAPDSIREYVNKNEIGKVILGKSISLFGTGTKRFSAKTADIGNVKIGGEGVMAKKIHNDKKIPIIIGGDHSITYRVIKGMNIEGDWGVLYFDAHPDMISSRGSYFGSVMNDISKLRGFSPKESMIVGMRTPEGEELDNIKKLGINVITPIDIEKNGMKDTLKKIKETVGKKIYLSIDMDVIDPAFAPGVTEPEPAGILPNQLLIIAKEIAKNKVLGLDLMEICPRYDTQNITQYLAYRIILEVISSMQK